MKRFFIKLALIVGLLASAAASAQTSVLPARIAAKQTTNIRLVTDSMGGTATWGYPYLFAQALMSKAPDATIVFKVRVYPGTGDGTVTSTMLQTGTGGYTLTVTLDSLPGSTSYRADMPDYIWGGSDHVGIIQLGVNDAVNFGLSSSYTPATYSANIRYLGKYPEEHYGTQIILIEPFWSDANGVPRIEIAGAAWLTRRLGKLNNWLVVPWRKVGEDHFTDVGQAGQGAWFPYPYDNTHCGASCNAAQAAALVSTVFP